MYQHANNEQQRKRRERSIGSENVYSHSVLLISICIEYSVLLISIRIDKITRCWLGLETHVYVLTLKNRWCRRFVPTTWATQFPTVRQRSSALPPSSLLRPARKSYTSLRAGAVVVPQPDLGSNLSVVPLARDLRERPNQGWGGSAKIKSQGW